MSAFLVTAASRLPTAYEDLAVTSGDEFLVSVEDAQQIGLLLPDGAQVVLSFLEIFFGEGISAVPIVYSTYHSIVACSSNIR